MFFIFGNAHRIWQLGGLVTKPYREILKTGERDIQTYKLKKT